MQRARVTPAVVPGWLVYRIPAQGVERWQWQAWGPAGTTHGWTGDHDAAVSTAQRERDRLRFLRGRMH